MKTKLFVTVAALVSFTAITFAQNPTTDQKSQPQPWKGLAYIDENNNGICDHRENGSGNSQPGQRNPNCPFRGQAMRQGMGKGLGPCGQSQPAMRNNRGPNFVDENKNGICDYREKSEKK